MGIAKLGNILNVFRGSEPTAEQKQALFHEAALMALARATSADTNIQPVEVASVQETLQKITGQQFTHVDVRVAAKSELFEKAPLDKYLSKVAGKLDDEHRFAIVNALAEVIRADVRISPREIEYYDMVAKSLNVSDRPELTADD